VKKLIYFLLLIIGINQSLVAQDEWEDYVSWAWGGHYSPYMEGTVEHNLYNPSIQYSQALIHLFQYLQNRK